MPDLIILATVFLGSIPFGLLIAAGMGWGGPCGK